jgi:hypothetical protein
LLIASFLKYALYRKKFMQFKSLLQGNERYFPTEIHRTHSLYFYLTFRRARNYNLTRMKILSIKAEGETKERESIKSMEKLMDSEMKEIKKSRHLIEDAHSKVE